MTIQTLVENGMVKQLIALYDYIPEVQFWVKDRKGVYVVVNRCFLQNYRTVNPNDVIGKTDYDLAPDYIADQWNADDKSVLNGIVINDRIELVCQNDHSLAWHITNKRAITDDDEYIIGSCGITRRLGETSSTEYPFTNLMPAIEHIKNNISQPILIDTLASLVHMSNSTFERKFKKYFKSSPLQFIKKLRLNIACQKLVSTDNSIADIARQCGFCDQSYMTKEFHRVIGITPSEYKEKNYKGE